MSSISFRRPEFRLHLGYPTIFLTHGQRTVARLDAAVDGLHAGLAEMAAIVTGARGRLVAVLPEEEVVRTRLDLAGRGRAERRASARIALGGRLGVAPDTLSVVIGRAGADGSFPVAGVRRTTLAETRALLAAVGLRPAAIVGAGLFPGFATAPRLGGGWALPRLDFPAIPPERRGLAAAAGAGAVLALALLVFSRPTPNEPLAAVETSQAALVPAVVAVATPPAAPLLGEPVTTAAAPAAPAALPSAGAPSTTALLTSPPPPPRPATLRTGGGVTLAARNMPADLPVRTEPEVRPLAKLAAITAAAPARALEAIAAPLRRPADKPVTDKPAPEKAAQKPVPAADVAAAARVATPTLRASAVPTELRPEPRPAARAASATRPAPDTSAAIAPRPRGSDQPAMLVASLEPAPLMQASIAAASAATLAAVLDEPPPARPDAPKPKPVAAKPVAKPATVAAKPAPKPVVARPQPVEVKSLVQQAAPPRPAVSTTPQPKIVPTTPQPKVAAVSTTPQPKVAAVKPVRTPVITAAPEPVRQKAVRAPAPQRQVVATAAPAAVAAPAPVRQKVVQKPVPVRQAAKPAPVRTTATKKAQPWAPEPVAAEKPRFSKPTAQRIGLTRGNVSLVGVFAGADGRRALVRLPNGNIERVKVGDQVQGVQIAAINEDSVQVAGRGGRNTLLRLPD